MSARGKKQVVDRRSVEPGGCPAVCLMFWGRVRIKSPQSCWLGFRKKREIPVTCRVKGKQDGSFSHSANYPPGMDGAVSLTGEESISGQEDQIALK